MKEGAGSNGEGGAMEALWRNVLEAMPGLVIVVNAERKVLYVNPAMADFCNRDDAAGFTGRPADEVLAPLPFEVQRALHSVLRTGSQVSSCITWSEREKGPVILESIAFPISLPGKGPLAAAAWTASVRPAEAPDQEGLAIEASRKKTKDLLSVVRHDILNQLTILIGFLQFSEDFIDNPQVREFLAKEEAAGQVIQALIEFTRDFQDLAVEDPRWMALDSIVASARERVDTRGVSIVTDLGATEVYASPLIRHVFLTLIKNALDHAHGLTRIAISAEKGERDLVVACEDDGPGIPEAERKTLFDRGHGRNRGYGLWLAGEILSITGASIREAGRMGGGARFEIRIPQGMWRDGRSR
ncbi:MAG TPA: ATP-binding protein [Methanolinea sp.]|nr:ATP-binding protein [Methanolinea sp.]HQK56014.1 ATP-binding protein [Methanolinea sp.]